MDETHVEQNPDEFELSLPIGVSDPHLDQGLNVAQADAQANDSGANQTKIAQKPKRSQVIDLEKSSYDKTSSAAIQWNDSTKQHEVKCKKSLQLTFSEEIEPNDHVELSVEHKDVKLKPVYSVKPVGEEQPKDLSVLNVTTDGEQIDVHYEKDNNGHIRVKVSGATKQIHFCFNTLSTSEHNDGRKENARYWKLRVKICAGGKVKKRKDFDLQVFETLRNTDRLVRAKRRNSNNPCPKTPSKVAKIEVEIKPKEEEAEEIQGLIHQYLTLQERYARSLSPEILQHKINELNKLV